MVLSLETKVKALGFSARVGPTSNYITWQVRQSRGALYRVGCHIGDKMAEVIVYRQHFEQFVGACAAGLRALELAN